MIRLGNIQLDVPFFQAALSGYSERPMRILARRYGAPLTFTGVLLDKIAMHPKAVRKLRFQPGDDEHPVGAQLLGDNPDTMARAAAAFEKIGFDLIDLNFACPAPKVLRRKRGGYHLKQPHVVIEIVNRVRDAVSCPVLMKIRTGFDSGEESVENFWRICENANAAGIDAITIHGRTVVKKYRGKADWKTIGRVKREFPNLTVFGSGDLMTAETIVERLAAGSVDGVTIARGAIGNPWIFSETRALLEGKEKPPEPTLCEQGSVMLEHFEMICEIRPQRRAVAFFRKFVAGYCKRHPERRKAQMAIIAAKTPNQLVDSIASWYDLGRTRRTAGIAEKKQDFL
jgi:nifR3 family TIM-barrel protein